MLDLMLVGIGVLALLAIGGILTIATKIARWVTGGRP
jgi:hypothetical protein